MTEPSSAPVPGESEREWTIEDDLRIQELLRLLEDSLKRLKVLNKKNRGE